MAAHPIPDGPEHTAETAATVLRYHLCWKHRDLDGVMALYHPDIQYNDFFQNRVLHLAELREYVAASMPRQDGEDIVHSDRIRTDGCTAFIQYQVTLRGGDGITAFRASEAITVRDGLIWQVNEYASLVREPSRHTGHPSLRPATSRLGLSPRQLSFMAQDLQHYFTRRQPYLDPQLDLQQVARECGYSRNQISYLLNQVLGQSFTATSTRPACSICWLNWNAQARRPRSMTWPSPPASIHCRRSTSAFASTPACRPRPTCNRFLCGHARKTIRPPSPSIGPHRYGCGAEHNAGMAQYQPLDGPA